MNTFRYDTHVHTSETSICGKVDAKTLVSLYKEAGYDGLIITDHYYRDFFEGLRFDDWKRKIEHYLKGYHHAVEEGKKIGLNILLGMELRFDENENDYLVYGFNEDFLLKHKQLYALNLKSFWERIANTPICIYQAHPFRITAVPASPEYLHGIEVYNGHPRHDSHNQQAYDYAIQHKLKMISGSDFHQTMDLARGGIVLPDSPTTSVELAKMLGDNKIIKLIHHNT